MILRRIETNVKTLHHCKQRQIVVVVMVGVVVFNYMQLCTYLITNKAATNFSVIPYNSDRLVSFVAPRVEK